MFFTIPYFMERMIEMPTISVLSVLSITAIITTISLFFCGIPICLEIWRRKNTDEITSFPFLMGFLGGTFWLRYGLLKYDLTMITVNVVGVALMFLYLLFYLYHTRSKTFILLELLVVFSIISAMLVLVEMYGETTLDPLGFVCMTFNILNFGAPLAGVSVVFKKKCCDSLPLPLCTANLLVSTQWCIYGVLVGDKYIIVSHYRYLNIAKYPLNTTICRFQWSWCAVGPVANLTLPDLPRSPGGKAPLAGCCPYLDLELNEKSELPSENVQVRNGCWSRQRVVDSRNFNGSAALPPSRSDCIAYLRSTTFNSGGYYAYTPYGGSMCSRTTAESTLPDTNQTAHLSRVEKITPPYSFNDSNTTNHLACSIANMPMGATSYVFNKSNGAGEPFEFDRIREIDDLEKQWTEKELKRTHSAPDLAAE
uniref:Sugar transporter SWEET1 n=1 Tax=Ditylenchus dipsaci TaxID=166011 RepID=A0A915D2Z7_9BILA